MEEDQCRVKTAKFGKMRLPSMRNSSLASPGWESLMSLANSQKYWSEKGSSSPMKKRSKVERTGWFYLHCHNKYLLKRETFILGLRLVKCSFIITQYICSLDLKIKFSFGFENEFHYRFFSVEGAFEGPSGVGTASSQGR